MPSRKPWRRLRQPSRSPQRGFRRRASRALAEPCAPDLDAFWPRPQDALVVFGAPSRRVREDFGGPGAGRRPRPLSAAPAAVGGTVDTVGLAGTSPTANATAGADGVVSWGPAVRHWVRSTSIDLPTAGSRSVCASTSPTRCLQPLPLSGKHAWFSRIGRDPAAPQRLALASAHSSTLPGSAWAWSTRSGDRGMRRGGSARSRTGRSSRPRLHAVVRECWRAVVAITMPSA